MKRAVKIIWLLCSGLCPAQQGFAVCLQRESRHQLPSYSYLSISEGTEILATTLYHTAI